MLDVWARAGGSLTPGQLILAVCGSGGISILGGTQSMQAYPADLRCQDENLRAMSASGGERRRDGSEGISLVHARIISQMGNPNAQMAPERRIS